jgi:MFS family permease
MMFVRTPLQFYIARFLLGAAEAGFFPGVLYYLTQWFSAFPISAAVMGALAGPLLALNGVRPVCAGSVEDRDSLDCSAGRPFRLP